MKRLITIALGFLVIEMGCCGSSRTAWEPVGKVEGDEPMAFVWKTPGYTRPDDPRREGLVAAVWEDGRVVRAISSGDVGKAYVRGRLTGEQVAGVTRLMAESGLLQAGSKSMPVLDAETEYVGMREGEKMRWWGHSPGFASSEDQRMTQVKARLMELPLSEVAERSAEQWVSYPRKWFE